MSARTAPVEPCALHGIRHRPGTTAAIACEALAAKAGAATPPAPGATAPAVTPLRHFTAEPIVVTPEDLREVLTGRRGVLQRRRLGPGQHVATVFALKIGDVIADVRGAHELVHECFGGDFEAAAADLTAALQLEQRLDTAA